MATAVHPASPLQNQKVKRFRGPGKKKNKKKKVEEGSAEHILQLDVKRVLNGKTCDQVPYERFQEIEVSIQYLSSSGDGIGLVNDDSYAVVVPFTLPGDKVHAKLHFLTETYALADFLDVIEPSKERDNSLIRCKYFAKCGGCQYQMLEYSKQLEQKRNVIIKAFEYFSHLQPGQLCEIGPTESSPMEYNYRTKITPHFDVPRGGIPEGTDLVIGFQEKGRRRVFDIEECSIATKCINESMPSIFAATQAKKSEYKRGATILLRDVFDENNEHKVETDHKAVVKEVFGKFTFKFPAGAFFQNNNSILPKFTSFVHSQLFNSFGDEKFEAPKYLVDAYCGSGLFSITCSEGFQSVIGVEISSDSVAYAKTNAEANGIKNAEYLVGEAEKIFAKIETPAAETAMIIDPPRKGCDTAFLDQLLTYSPARVVYISCNVHTQARDISYILNHELGKDYKINDVRGFDLFPQSHHVESVLTFTKCKNEQASA
ncbi:tRNA methyltransferase Trm2 [Schizosaccharomyces japonicus yFS275]|uniref:tRNA methyltransferase Trm2 n=1 Tax=Schizosaccharomyces japonicus (strain yFS275 / FY16936) TaxID=402676 RepID=B6K7M0_SCHJY|nr:tRNA methyltransferase Trm2 [Schizosaccharomyces japonicus yFS275]EEB09524.2 tRNA methyltransferase Trm2 [Schizosaccharomyces japonicus yFS275]